MSADWPEKVRTCFHALLDLDAEARARHLSDLARSQPELARELAELLAQAEDDGDTFEDALRAAPAAVLDEGLTELPTGTRLGAGSSPAFSEAALEAEDPDLSARGLLDASTAMAEDWLADDPVGRAQMQATLAGLYIALDDFPSAQPLLEAFIANDDGTSPRVLRGLAYVHDNARVAITKSVFRTGGGYGVYLSHPTTSVLTAFDDEGDHRARHHHPVRRPLRVPPQCGRAERRRHGGRAHRHDQRRR